MTIAEQISEVQARIATAQRERTRAEASKIAAQTNLERIQAELRDEFGITTVAEAEARLSQLSAQLAESLQAISLKLDKMGL